ncbi:immunity protein YezG family protein [Shewanella nanhaiensis]|uniref:Antitoxin YezG family protein n=1 Tax=Shewanella nanhaiensis TaxID=2864872 RepID=A0ABS7E9E0_9GAMM|nr:immunity protein YezG family protein [Shewanella nanhaiensis]MBW8186309.1 antitoxin YezG family protein [Shewanella nanhaiensis]
METIDSIYTAIAQHMLNQIDEEWSGCKVDVEFFEGAAEFDTSYISEQGVECDLKGGYPLFKLFKELHELTTDNQDNKWNRAKFSLEPSGKFNMEFEWDQELADEIERLSNE